MPNGGKLFIRSYLTQMNEPRNGIGRRSGDRFKLGEEAIMVEIEDTGIGISAEDVKKVFDPFFTTKGPRDGVGLGLSVTKNIIDIHNGIIEIKSEKKKGTKVTIALRIYGG
jgi:signal transduction histidine kinase